MKKIMFIFLVFLAVFYIYCLNLNKKIYYVSIGDFLSNGINNTGMVNSNYNDSIIKFYNKRIKNYVNSSYLTDYRVMDLINDIEQNKVVYHNNKKYRIQNLLIKANVMVISIGKNDLMYKKNINSNITYDYMNELLKDIDNLLALIRKYNKDDIYFLGFYEINNQKSIIKYANKQLKKICDRYNIKFVDISKLNNYINEGIYPSDLGYQYISDQIISLLK